jgi:hypothetical protein
MSPARATVTDRAAIGNQDQKGDCVTAGIQSLGGRAALLFAACLLALALAAPAARADFGFASAQVEMNNSDGTPSRQAGAHPDLTFRVRFNERVDPITGDVVPDENLRDFRVDLPPGLVGNPTVAATCEPTELRPLTGITSEIHCPVASQVGFVRVLNAPREEFNEQTFIRTGVFNMTHGPEVPATFAFIFAGVLTNIIPSINPGEYEIESNTSKVSQAEPLYGFELELWGVPANPIHDPQRQGILHPGVPGEETVIGAPSPDRPKPFLSAPTSCGTQTAVTITADSWQQPNLPVSSTIVQDPEGTPFQTQGCDLLGFAPTVSVQPRVHIAGQPTGLDFDLSLPQNENPAGLATPAVRKTVVTFPKGVAVSPSAATGLAACSPADIKLHSNVAPTCPDSSKVGTVTIKTPLLEEELEGDVIVARQRENPFGSLLAVYLSIKGPNFYLKLPGRIDADAADGQLTATFDNTPQLPFQHLEVSLNGGPSAVLSAPDRCGTYDTRTEITSWASTEPVAITTPMTINEGCGTPGFNPALRAGTTNPAAGHFSPFTLQVIRNDGEQNISRIEATLPEGLLAKLGGVPLCPDAQAASGACPASSQVGTTTIGVGPGSNPLYVPEAGKAPTAVYLAGPYKGAPYSLVVKVLAQAGPFDLGTVTVRNGLYVDPTTTQVTAKSDPLPQILEGIPLSYRDVRVEITRPEFTVNPTSCEPMKVSSLLTSSGGATASPSSPFQVANCEALGFSPKLALSLSGGTTRAKDPALKAVLTAPAGQANIGKVQVVLPKSVFIDNRHIANPCTRVQFDAGAGNGTQCPAKSILGKATAYSPLLSGPLTGKVYFRSNGGERKLPDLVASLGGQIHVNLIGFIDSVHKKGTETSRTRNTFASVPDAPVSKFVLELSGGKKGLLQNSTNLCKSTNRATVKMDGQNGKVHDFETVVEPSCGTKKK